MYNSIDYLKYSPDSKNYWYTAQKDGKYYLLYTNCDNQKVINPNISQDTTWNIGKTSPEIMKWYIVSRYALKKTSKWKKYIKQIDEIFEILSDSKLEKLHKKISSLPSSSRNNKKYKELFDYMQAKIEYELFYSN